MNEMYFQLIKYKLPRIATLIFCLQLSVLMMLMFRFNNQSLAESGDPCDVKPNLLSADTFYKISGKFAKNKSQCFAFYAKEGETLVLNTTTEITILKPSNNAVKLQGKDKMIIQQTGKYSIIINANQGLKNFDIYLNLEPRHLDAKPYIKDIEASNAKFKDNNITSQLTYNVVTPPAFKENNKLQEIVNTIVNLVQSKGLPVERFSVSLVDLSSSECCAYASYSDQEPRFPASVAKLFWMVYLYGQYQAGVLPEGTVPAKKLSKMIQDSDNESASFIVNTITQTKPGESLPPEEMEKWKQKRFALNWFFKKAGYSKINISQKVFPTDYAKNDEPAGRELQIRGEDKLQPIRNFVNTYDLARLMLEIYTDKALSKKYSNQMQSLLRRDLHKSAWKNKPFNAIEGFLGESLPEDAYFASKMGWNSGTRNDAAIIKSPDGKHKYILVVFGDDPSFYQDKTIYPEISLMVYKSMTNKNS